MTIVFVEEVAVEALNAEFPKGLDPGSANVRPTHSHSPQWMSTPNLRQDCKAHVLEHFPELFDGIGTMKDAGSSP